MPISNLKPRNPRSIFWRLCLRSLQVKRPQAALGIGSLMVGAAVCSLLLNLNQLAVRQAMAYAIDRQRVSSIGEYGYEPPSNQAGIVTPTFSSWLDKSLLAKYNYGYDPAKAKSVLEKAGYKMGRGGVMEKGGTKLSFTIINVGGNSDWVASVQVIQSELAQVGIKITPENLSSTDFTPDLLYGRFQLAYDNETGGPTPYYELRQLLYSGN